MIPSFPRPIWLIFCIHQDQNLWPQVSTKRVGNFHARN
jgi:hypothetical protein